MENKLILKRKYIGFVPFFIPVKNELKEINNVLFYDKDGIKFQTNCGYFVNSPDYINIVTNFTYYMYNNISFNDNVCFITNSSVVNKVNLFIPVSFLKKYEYIENCHYNNDEDGNEIVCNRHTFEINGYSFIINDSYKTIYTPANTKRMQVFKNLNIKETDEIKDALKKLIANNININELFD